MESRVVSIRLDANTEATLERLRSRYSTRTEVFKQALLALEEKNAYIDRQMSGYRWDA